MLETIKYIPTLSPDPSISIEDLFWWGSLGLLIVALLMLWILKSRLGSWPKLKKFIVTLMFVGIAIGVVGVIKPEILMDLVYQFFLWTGIIAENPYMPMIIPDRFR